MNSFRKQVKGTRLWNFDISNYMWQNLCLYALSENYDNLAERFLSFVTINISTTPSVKITQLALSYLMQNKVLINESLQKMEFFDYDSLWDGSVDFYLSILSQLILLKDKLNENERNNLQSLLRKASYTYYNRFWEILERKVNPMVNLHELNVVKEKIKHAVPQFP